jgi:hypothetical protein
MSGSPGEDPDDPLIDALAAYDDRLAAGITRSTDELYALVSQSSMHAVLATRPAYSRSARIIWTNPVRESIEGAQILQTILHLALASIPRGYRRLTTWKQRLPRVERRKSSIRVNCLPRSEPRLMLHRRDMSQLLRMTGC